MGVIGELDEELRRLVRGLNGQTAVFSGCLGVLAAQAAWTGAEGALPAPQVLPLFTALGATLAAHSFFLASRGLLLWVGAADLRLGRGSGWALVEAALLPREASSLNPGLTPKAGEFEISGSAGPALMRRTKVLAWLAPPVLAAAAAVFFFREIHGASLACAFGAALGTAEAMNLTQSLKTASCR